MLNGDGFIDSNRLYLSLATMITLRRSLFGADDDGGDHHRSPLLGQTKALVKNTNKEETIDRESADEEPNGCDGSLAPITSLL